MEGEEVTANDLVNVVSGQILSGPDDSVFDDIFDWIANAIKSIVDSVTDWIDKAVSSITGTVTLWINWLYNSVRGWIDSVLSLLGSARDWVVDTYYRVSDWVRDAWNIVYSAASSAIGEVWDWIVRSARNTWDWITREVREVLGWITAAAANLGSTIWGWLQEQGANIMGSLSTWGENIVSWLTKTGAGLQTSLSSLSGQLATSFDWLTSWMTENIVVPMDAWWSGLKAQLFNFTEWLPTLLDTLESWVKADIPGSSPRWTGWFASIWQFLSRPWGMSWRFDLSNFWEDLQFGVTKALSPLGDMFEAVVSGFMEAVEGFIKQVGQMSPDTAIGNYQGLAKIGMIAIGGLTAMTVAGEFLNPVSHLGLGHISAMVYDMTNYKLITGAMMGALTYAMLRTPLTYHFNELFRPFILRDRDFMQLMSRQAWSNPEALQQPALTSSVKQLTGGDGEAYERKVIGYYGYPDIYYGLYKELANTPLRYFPLAGIARTGFFDTIWFTEALHRSGYSKTAIDALMVMYKKMVDENVQGSMSGAAVKRFKEGLTTEEQFSGELMMLGYSEEQIPKYMAAARMDYAYDYTMDLISAFRDAVRKGNISIDDYRSSLLNLGIVPERVEGYVLRERARLKPKEPLTPIAPRVPSYETDAGKVIVDTTRRLRRKLLMSRDEELASLIELGMEPAYATAIANNDDVRLAEKGAEE